MMSMGNGPQMILRFWMSRATIPPTRATVEQLPMAVFLMIVGYSSAAGTKQLKWFRLHHMYRTLVAHTLTCVHVDNGEACGGTELPNEGEDDLENC